MRRTLSPPGSVLPGLTSLCAGTGLPRNPGTPASLRLSDGARLGGSRDLATDLMSSGGTVKEGLIGRH